MPYFSENTTSLEVSPMAQDPSETLKNFFYKILNVIPLEGIVVGYLDNLTYTTYWLKHTGIKNTSVIPCAKELSKKDSDEFMGNSSWDSEKNWLRIIHEPKEFYMSKIFMEQINESDLSVIQFRSYYDNSKKISVLFYVKQNNMYEKKHLDALMEHLQHIDLISFIIVKDFLLERLSIDNNMHNIGKEWGGDSRFTNKLSDYAINYQEIKSHFKIFYSDFIRGGNRSRKRVFSGLYTS